MKLLISFKNLVILVMQANDGVQTWDTQSDMAFALLGAIVALVTLKYNHDIQISKLMAKH